MTSRILGEDGKGWREGLERMGGRLGEWSCSRDGKDGERVRRICWSSSFVFWWTERVVWTFLHVDGRMTNEREQREGVFTCCFLRITLDLRDLGGLRELQ